LPGRAFAPHAIGFTAILLVVLSTTTDGRTAAAEDPSSFEAKANQILCDVLNGNFDEVRAQFVAPLQDVTSEDVLVLFWLRYRAVLGPFESADPPTAEAWLGMTTVSMALHFAKGDGEIRITFAPDGSVVGLAFGPPVVHVQE
jgi:hypothetical protein